MKEIKFKNLEKGKSYIVEYQHDYSKPFRKLGKGLKKKNVTSLDPFGFPDERYQLISIVAIELPFFVVQFQQREKQLIKLTEHQKYYVPSKEFLKANKHNCDNY